MPTILPERRTRARQSASESSISAQIGLSVALCLGALLCIVILTDWFGAAASPPDDPTETALPLSLMP
jgi:hypothetical protein